MNIYKLSYIIIISLLVSCSSSSDKSDAYGTFEATEVTVSSELNGKLLDYKIDEGQVLNVGDVAARIDSSDWVYKREQLIANRNSIESRLDNIASQIEVQKQQKENLIVEKNRIEKLVKNAAATTKQLDDINANISVIDKQIKSIETQMASIPNDIEAINQQIAQINLSIKKCNIVNPIKGTVLSKYMQESEITTVGKAIYKIADIEKMYLRVYVSGNQLPSLKIGQKVQVMYDKDKKDNNTTEGEITWISSNAEFTPKIIQTKEDRVNLVYAVKVLVKNNGNIKIGMPGEIKFGK